MWQRHARHRHSLFSLILCFISSLYFTCVPACTQRLFLFNDQGDARGCQRVPENVLSSSKPFQGIFVRRRLGNTEVCRHPPTWFTGNQLQQFRQVADNNKARRTNKAHHKSLAVDITHLWKLVLQVSIFFFIRTSYLGIVLTTTDRHLISNRRLQARPEIVRDNHSTLCI